MNWGNKMALVNIGSKNASDQFYRYKMPAIEQRIEGRGNGIKTNIVNLVDIAKALARPPTYVLKWFGFELGALTKFEEKDGKSIVNGAHDAKVLAEHLETFIKKFVQCFSCGNPETVFSIDKRTELISMKCKACGHVSDCDARHKLCNYIVKNPPVKDKSKEKKDKQLRRAEQERENEGAELDAAEEKRKRKEEKRMKKLQAEQQSSQNESSDKDKRKKKSSKEDEDGGDDVEWATDTSAAAAKARAEEQLTGNAADMVTVSKELKTQLSLTQESIKKEEEEESESESESEEEDERITKLRAYAAKVNDVDQTLEFLDTKLGVGSDELKVYFLIEAILDDEKPVPVQLKKKKAFLAKFVADDEKKQRGLLNALELYATDTNTDAYKIFAAILNALYELDLCEEKCIREWFDDVRSAKKFGVDEKTAKAVRKQAASFIEFLNDDDDDDDSEDDSEDDSD